MTAHFSGRKKQAKKELHLFSMKKSERKWRYIFPEEKSRQKNCFFLGEKGLMKMAVHFSVRKKQAKKNCIFSR